MGSILWRKTARGSCGDDGFVTSDHHRTFWFGLGRTIGRGGEELVEGDNCLTFGLSFGLNSGNYNWERFSDLEERSN